MQTKGCSDSKRKQLAAIHCAKRDLGLDDETYRAAIWAICRSRSAAELDEPARLKLLDHFKNMGWKSRRKGRPVPSDDRAPLLRKIDALLVSAGRDREYVERGMLRHMFGPGAPARLDWCEPEKLRRVVAALMYDARRRAKK
jgi:phage gp16-like protein